MSWHKVSDILHIVDNPEKVTPLIQGLVGLDNTAVFIQTLREVSQLPNLDELTKAPESDLRKYILTSVTSMWGLAYALQGWANTGAKLAKALRVSCQLFPLCTGVNCREEALATSISLLLDKMYAKGWTDTIRRTDDYKKYVIPKIRQIPSLAQAYEYLEN